MKKRGKSNEAVCVVEFQQKRKRGVIHRPSADGWMGGRKTGKSEQKHRLSDTGRQQADRQTIEQQTDNWRDNGHRDRQAQARHRDGDRRQARSIQSPSRQPHEQQMDFLFPHFVIFLADGSLLPGCSFSSCLVRIVSQLVSTTKSTGPLAALPHRLLPYQHFLRARGSPKTLQCCLCAFLVCLSDAFSADLAFALSVRLCPLSWFVRARPAKPGFAPFCHPSSGNNVSLPFDSNPRGGATNRNSSSR